MFTSLNFGDDMSIIIPLKNGQENSSIQYEKLNIIPVSLWFISEPKHYIRFEFKVIFDENKENSTVLIYNENEMIKNYPQLFENYLFDLEIIGDDINLKVEKFDFEKLFFMEYSQKATVESFSISFVDYRKKWYMDRKNNAQYECFFFTLLLSDDNEQKEISFDTLFPSVIKLSGENWPLLNETFLEYILAKPFLVSLIYFL